MAFQKNKEKVSEEFRDNTWAMDDWASQLVSGLNPNKFSALCRLIGTLEDLECHPDSNTDCVDNVLKRNTLIPKWVALFFQELYYCVDLHLKFSQLGLLRI